MKKLFTVLSLVFMLSLFVLPVKAEDYSFIYTREGKNARVWQQMSGSSCQLKVLEYDVVISVDGTFDMLFYTAQTNYVPLANNLNHYDYTYHVTSTSSCTTTDQAILNGVPAKNVLKTSSGWGFKASNPDTWGYPGVWFQPSKGDNYSQVVPLLQAINGKLSHTNEDLDIISAYIENQYKEVESNEISAWQYWQLLGGVQSDNNGSYFHSYMQMTGYSNDQAYTANKSFLLRKNQPMYITFYSSNYNAGNQTPSIYSNNADNLDKIKIQNIQYFESRGLYYQTFKVYLEDTASVNVLRAELEWNMNSSTTNVVPIYFGTGVGLSNEQKSAFGIDTDLVTPDVNANDQSNDDFNDAAADLIGQEDSWNNKMNQSINAIDFNGQVTNNASFLGAANFLVTMFNLMTNNNPFGYFIIFFAIICIAKILIGRKKK